MERKKYNFSIKKCFEIKTQSKSGEGKGTTKTGGGIRPQKYPGALQRRKKRKGTERGPKLFRFTAGEGKSEGKANLKKKHGITS